MWFCWVLWFCMTICSRGINSSYVDCPYDIHPSAVRVPDLEQPGWLWYSGIVQAGFDSWVRVHLEWVWVTTQAFTLFFFLDIFHNVWHAIKEFQGLAPEGQFFLGYSVYSFHAICTGQNIFLHINYTQILIKRDQSMLVKEHSHTAFVKFASVVFHIIHLV